MVNSVPDHQMKTTLNLYTSAPSEGPYCVCVCVCLPFCLLEARSQPQELFLRHLPDFSVLVGSRSHWHGAWPENLRDLFVSAFPGARITSVCHYTQLMLFIDLF